MRRLLAVVLLAMLALPACASSGRASRNGEPGSVPASTVNASDSRPSAVAGTDRRTGGALAVSGSTPRPTSSAVDYKNTMPLAVIINRDCAAPGDRIEIVADTLANSLVGFSSYYPDDNNFPPDIMFFPSDANPTGHYVWTFVLRPGTPLGPSRVEVIAMHNPESAYWRGSFRVQSAC